MRPARPTSGCRKTVGSTHDNVFDVSYGSALRQAGCAVEVVPNQCRSAAAARIEAGRRLFPSIGFNEATTSAGLDALGGYHERKDETRSIGLGAEHDWSSHGADAFGLMCLVAEDDRFRSGAAVGLKRRRSAMAA